MVVYMLTEDPDVIRKVDEDMYIPRGHRLWDVYEEWLDAGNAPAPYVTITFV